MDDDDQLGMDVNDEMEQQAHRSEVSDESNMDVSSDESGSIGFSSDTSDDFFVSDPHPKLMSSHEELFLIYKKHRLTREAMVDLLKFMTDRNIDVPRSFYKFDKLTVPATVNELSGGVYSYFGLKNSLDIILKRVCNQNQLSLNHGFIPVKLKN